MASYDSSANQDIDIQIDLDVLAEALVNDQTFIATVTKAVRDQLLKDARSKGNLFGKYAQTPPTTQNLTAAVTPIVLSILKKNNL
jgi:hypothetical protein